MIYIYRIIHPATIVALPCNDLILVHRKLGQKLITMEDFINLHNSI